MLRVVNFATRSSTPTQSTAPTWSRSRAWAARAFRGVICALSPRPTPKTIEKRGARGPSCPVITRAEIQLLRSLRDKKHREELGLFAVEGEKIVAELQAAGHPFERIYATEAWAGEATHRISPPDMARASHFPTPSSVLAVGRIRRAGLSPGELDRGLTLALDGVQDPGNVGTMLRIADWFGLERVLLSPECADLHSAKVIHASMGSFARVRAVVVPAGRGLGRGIGAGHRLRARGPRYTRRGGRDRCRGRHRERGPRPLGGGSRRASRTASRSRGAAGPNRLQRRRRGGDRVR